MVLEPNKEPYVKEIENTLESRQAEIWGGYIQLLYNYRPLLIVCDEDGKLKNLPYNRPLLNDFLVGKCFVTADNGEGEFASLTDEQIEQAIKLFTLKKEKIIMNILETQGVMQKVFPKYKQYPLNSMIPALSLNDNKIVVSMLIIADDEMIKDFIIDQSGMVDVEINTYLDNNEYNIGKDLKIRFDFYYPTGHPIFEATIHGDLLDRQKDFVEALKMVDSIVIWIADKNRKVKKVMNVSWDYNLAKHTLDQLV